MANAGHEVIILDDDSSPEPELKRESTAHGEAAGSPPQKRARVEPAAFKSRLMGSDPPPPMDFFEVRHPQRRRNGTTPRSSHCFSKFKWESVLSPLPQRRNGSALSCALGGLSNLTYVFQHRFVGAIPSRKSSASALTQHVLTDEGGEALKRV